MVPTAEIREQLVGKGQQPARYQPSDPGSGFSFLVRTVCAHSAPDTFRTRQQASVRLGKGRRREINELNLKQEKQESNRESARGIHYWAEMSNNDGDEVLFGAGLE